jgi:hypothetical protein
MLDYLALAEDAMNKIRALAPVIAKELDRRHGRKIQTARTQQERDNLRQHYTVALNKENVWHNKYAGDRDLFISLATMYGIAALVEEAES